MESLVTKPKATDFIIHLSHNDLDGVTCHFLTSYLFDRYKLITSDYDEFRKKVDVVIGLTQELTLEGIDVFLLITDISVSLELCEVLDARLPKRCGLAVLDHHVTTKPCSKKYDWCSFSNGVSAAKMTYQFYGEPEVALLKTIVYLTNISDMGQVEKKGYSVSEFLSQQVYELINMPSATSEIVNSYRFYILIRVAQNRMRGDRVADLEKKLPVIRSDYLRCQGVPAYVINDYDLSFKDKFYQLIGHNLDFSEVPRIQVEGVSIGVFYQWNDNLFRHLVLNNNQIKELYDYAILIKANGRISTRSLKDGFDAAKLMEAFFSGGGHKEQAGGRMPLKHCSGLQNALFFLRRQLHDRKKKVIWRSLANA